MAVSALMAATEHSLAAQGAAFEAILLLVSALHKAVHRSHLEKVVHEFAGVSRVLAPAVLAAVAVTEITAASLLLLPMRCAFGAVLAALIWAVYLAFVVRALVRGRSEMDCGCSFVPTQRPLGWYQVTRNLLLMGVSAFVAVTAWAGGGNGIRGAQLFAACALLAVYAALDAVMALRPLHSRAVA